MSDAEFGVMCVLLLSKVHGSMSSHGRLCRLRVRCPKPDILVNAFMFGIVDVAVVTEYFDQTCSRRWGN